MTALALALPIVAASLAAHRYLRLTGPSGIVSSTAIGAGFGIGLSSIPFFLWRLLDLPVRAYPLADAALWLAVAALAMAPRAKVPPRPAMNPDAFPAEAEAETSRTPAAITSGFDRSLIVCTVGILLTAALSAAVIDTRLAHAPHGEWDAWAYWQVRAAFLSSPDGWRNAFVLHSNPDYPLMLPAAVARVWTMAGHSTAAPAAMGVIFTISTAALLLGALWRTGPLVAAAGAGLLLVPEFLFHGTGQCADVPLAYYALAGAILLSGPGTARRAVVSGIAIGLAAWTKNEGIVVAAAMPVAFAIFSWRDLGWAKVRPLVIGVLAGMTPAVIALVLYHVAIDPRSGLTADLVQAGPLAKLTDWSRHQAVLQFVVVHTARWGQWAAFSPVWIAAAWTVAGSVRRRTRPAIAAGRLTVVAMLAATYLVYVLTPYDLDWHMLTSWTRIVAQVWPLAVWTSLAWISRDSDAVTPTRVLTPVYSRPMPVDKELLEILACPACKTPVTLVKDGTALKCATCHRVYPIKDDIPVMLIDEATVEP